MVKRILVIMSALVLVACGGYTDNKPPVSNVPLPETQKMELVAAYKDTTPIGYAGIYKFTDGDVTCYVTSQAMQCVVKENQ